jgi:phage regulator Rha-like protein
MNKLNLISNNELKMSSRDIADLTGKKHSHVKRDIDKMCSEINPPEVESSTFEHRGNIYTQYHLDKNLTLCLISGYSAKLRMAIIKRWDELENNTSPSLPNFNNPAEAARAWANEYEQKLELKSKLEEADNEVSRLQGVCHTISAQFRPGTTPAEFCRQLNGVNVQKVQSHLAEKGMLIKQYRGYKASSYYRDNWFAEKMVDCNDGQTSNKVVLTKKGAVNIYKLYLKKDLPMKVSWDGEFTHCLFD